MAEVLVMPVHWSLLGLLALLLGGVLASSRSDYSWKTTAEEQSQHFAIVVSSQAVRVRGGDPQAEEPAVVRPMPRKRITRDTVDGAIKNAKGDEGGTRRPETTDLSEPVNPLIQNKDRDNYEELIEEGRGHMKKMKKMMKKFMPYMMIPGMMALGYMPFALASLKMFVMNAMMLNMMAFNAAIFLTLRNMVFGPRKGEHIKYHNFGYSHDHRKRFVKRHW